MSTAGRGSDDPPVGHADLHVHPSGDGFRGATAREMYTALRASDLRIAVLADHNRIGVARELVARSLDDAPLGGGADIRLIVGEEITTRGGHLVGIGLQALVPSRLSLADSIAAVHDQGGIAVVAHPLLPTWISATADLLMELADGDPRSRPDALEAMHPLAAWLPGWRRRVEGLARRCDYAIVGGSDAHIAASIGRARTVFPGRTEADLVAAILSRATRAEGRRYGIREILGRRVVA